MANSLTRLTLYALISSIEEDLRTNLAAHIPANLTLQSVFGTDLLKKLATRSDSNGATDETSFSLEDLLMLCDYGDTIQLAHRFDASLPDELKRQLDENSVELDLLIATRNRVMHSRPLEFDDLANTSDLADELLKKTRNWPSLFETKTELTSTPELAFTFTIPSEADDSSTSHNLPLPDFDETGFIGRRTTINNLRRAIEGVYPVVTIVGEGGLGKTSLAIKVAYDILDSKTSKFDTIVFVSAKTQRLTETEIQRIKGAINS